MYATQRYKEKVNESPTPAKVVLCVAERSAVSHYIGDPHTTTETKNGLQERIESSGFVHHYPTRTHTKAHTHTARTATHNCHSIVLVCMCARPSVVHATTKRANKKLISCSSLWQVDTFYLSLCLLAALWLHQYTDSSVVIHTTRRIYTEQQQLYTQCCLSFIQKVLCCAVVCVHMCVGYTSFQLQHKENTNAPFAGM